MLISLCSQRQRQRVSNYPSQPCLLPSPLLLFHFTSASFPSSSTFVSSFSSSFSLPSFLFLLSLPSFYTFAFSFPCNPQQDSSFDPLIGPWCLTGYNRKSPLPTLLLCFIIPVFCNLASSYSAMSRAALGSAVRTREFASEMARLESVRPLARHFTAENLCCLAL